MASHPPRISVGLPVYNGERFVAEAIDSVLQQTYSDFELIISDNASTDRTEEICRAYVSQDQRVKYYRSAENVGAARNIRHVFERSSAPYFKWLCHDDTCGPRFLEKCVTVLDECPNVVVCHSRSAFIDEQGNFLREHNVGCHLQSSRPSDRARQYILQSTDSYHAVYGLIRKAALKKTSLLAPYVNSDVVLILQLALLGEIYEVSDVLLFFRDHLDRTNHRFKTYAEIVSWHDPSKQSRWQFPRWRVMLELARSISRTGLEIKGAVDCYWALLKWCRWNYKGYMQEIVYAGRSIGPRTFSS